jgi:hypothetical protein
MTQVVYEMKLTYSKVSAIALVAIMAGSALTLMIGQEADARSRNTQTASQTARDVLAQLGVQVGVTVDDVNVANCVIAGQDCRSN